MTDPSDPRLNMTLLSPPSTDIAGELVTAAPETNTLYVLEDDVLLLPGVGLSDSDMTALENIERHLGVAMIGVVEGLDQPWLLRKATPLPEDSTT